MKKPQIKLKHFQHWTVYAVVAIVVLLTIWEVKDSEIWSAFIPSSMEEMEQLLSE